MAAQRSLSSATSSDSRRVSASGEQPTVSSPRELARPGSAQRVQENGSSGVPTSLSLQGFMAVLRVSGAWAERLLRRARLHGLPAVQP